MIYFKTRKTKRKEESLRKWTKQFTRFSFYRKYLRNHDRTIVVNAFSLIVTNWSNTFAQGRIVYLPNARTVAIELVTRLQVCLRASTRRHYQYTILPTSCSHVKDTLVQVRAKLPRSHSFNRLFTATGCSHCPGGYCWTSQHCQRTERLDCHDQCLGECHGPTESECYVCKHYRHEGKCVETCPSDLWVIFCKLTFLPPFFIYYLFTNIFIVNFT